MKIIYKTPKEIDLLKIWHVLKINKFIILGFTALATLIAIIYCIFATPIFTANVTINPPKLSDSGSGLATILGGVTVANLSGNGLFAQKSDADITIRLLSTRFVLNQVAKNLDLVHAYKVKNIDRAIGVLQKATIPITDTKTGFLDINVDSKNPKLAAAIANYYPIALGMVISKVGLDKTSQKKQFYDNQVSQSRQDLLNAQNMLKDFLTKNGITAGTQTSIVTGISTQLQAQLAVAQSQLNAMQRYATTDNPDYRQLQSHITSLKAQIVSLSGTTTNGDPGVTLPPNLAPGLAQQYMNLVMQVTFRTEVYNLLLKQFLLVL